MSFLILCGIQGFFRSHDGKLAISWLNFPVGLGN
jgi:hypothetical protein